jgi:hypothetical protein
LNADRPSPPCGGRLCRIAGALALAIGLAAAERVDAAASGVHWTFVGPGAVTFDWRGPDSLIRYGLTSEYTHTALAGAPMPMPYSSPGPYREVRLENLRPNTTFHYAIGDGPDRTFHTPPLRGSAGFTVMVQGDVGDSQHFPNVLPVQQLIASQSPDFVLVVGDLTYGDDNGSAAVDQHFDDVMVWSERAAYMPIWGNHDWGSSRDDLRNYKGRFAFPNPQTSPGAPSSGCCGEDWYWFDYGNVRFIAYPEPYGDAWEDWEPRADALMREVRDDPQIRFIVTFGHRPAYSSGGHDGSASLAEMIDALGSAHPKYVLNLNGHSHNYERTFPQNGVVHVTAGAGGSSLDARSSSSCRWDGGCPAPTWSAVRALRHSALRLRFGADMIEGTVLCGPADEGENDVACEPGAAIDRFRIGPRRAGDLDLLSPRVTPNPVARRATLSFTTPRAGPIRVQLVDLAGRRIQTLHDEPSAPAGFQSIPLDVGRQRSGLSAGLYFLRIRTVDGERTERISIVR